MKTKLLVALMACLALGACSKSETAKEETTTTTTTETTTTQQREGSSEQQQAPANQSSTAQPQSMNENAPADANAAQAAHEDQQVADKVHAIQNDMAASYSQNQQAADANHAED